MIGKEYYLIKDETNVANGFEYKEKVKVIGYCKYMSQEACVIEYKDVNGILINNGVVLKNNLKRGKTWSSLTEKILNVLRKLTL